VRGPVLWPIPYIHTYKDMLHSRPCALNCLVASTSLLQLTTDCLQSQSHIATDGHQSVSLGVEPQILFDSYGPVFVERPLRREDGFVFCICCWPLPVQSFLGPSPLGLATIFYCLRFETSLFVSSYDSQVTVYAAFTSKSSARTTQKTQPLYCFRGVFTSSCRKTVTARTALKRLYYYCCVHVCFFIYYKFTIYSSLQ
jgi:hypothetical protein